MEAPHTQIFYLLFIAVIIGLGVVSYQAIDVKDPQVQANKDNINFTHQTSLKRITATFLFNGVVYQTSLQPSSLAQASASWNAIVAW